MKLLILVIVLVVFSSLSCRKQLSFSLAKNGRNEIIAIQPLDDFDVSSIDSVINEISKVYDRRVIILPSIKIPDTFINQETNKYSADSILNLLSEFQKDNVVEIIGLTNYPIFTTKQIKQITYLDDKIFGMSYQPGNTCVVSDYRLKTGNQKLYNRRLRNVIMHEVGHNLGLSHCPNDKCIMSTETGRYENLDLGNDEYCDKCKGELLQ